MNTKYLLVFCPGIDVDIDVEHEGHRTKVTPTPTPPDSEGPPSVKSDGGLGASDGAEAKEGSVEVDGLSSLGSASGGAKVGHTHTHTTFGFLLFSY